jgi:hypothetical protein
VAGADADVTGVGLADRTSGELVGAGIVARGGSPHAVSAMTSTAAAPSALRSGRSTFTRRWCLIDDRMG